MSNVSGLNSIEKRAAISLALVFGLRMLGLFMIMPVFAIYGQELDGYSPMWVGIAIGAYGLTQALLQIPMGMLSDRFGRKPVILIGLAIFCIGSLIAAYADSVMGVTIGRAIQGMGAIASTILALAADVTRDEHRPKVMATIGMCIGLSFAVSLILGPVLVDSIGLSGLFNLTAGLALLGMLVVLFIAPNAVSKAPKGDTRAAPELISAMLKDGQLLRLDVGIFVLHLVITSIFVVLPLMLMELDFATTDHWQLYFPTLLVSFVLMVPLIIIGAKNESMKQMYRFSLLLLAVSLVMMYLLQGSFIGLFVAVIVFFTAFNYLEASLPSLIAKFAPAGQKGTAMGIYSSSQFFGAFWGGILGGLCYQYLGLAGVFATSTILVIAWWFYTAGMVNPKVLKTYTLDADAHDQPTAENMSQQLMALPGVKEAIVIFDDQAAYLKVDAKVFELNEARAVLLAPIEV
ncbi:MFS transporter [Psychrobium sp. 1_MG-2023]|uniref:MFS transporter n=1 Tax=Psychrobium sp. 1_MG-2023 TaxID=3062624 RepID=UPI000C323509|nr:MFS transporter [Psychrobium sp. 1_MG-2023]MDP2562282.1 MFS transporter [Psychrobium sp. 1_MG-2023]PKF54665.1 MFS transporter [Alteromonadales bacterium alter-6D02]